MSDTVNIDQFAERLGISVPTLRVRISKKSVPAPMKRNKGEPYRWKKSVVDNFLGVTPKSTTSDLSNTSLDQAIREIVRQELRQMVLEGSI